MYCYKNELTMISVNYHAFLTVTNKLYVVNFLLILKFTALTAGTPVLDTAVPPILLS